MLEVLHDFFLLHALLIHGVWTVRLLDGARFDFVHILHQLVSHGFMDLFLRLKELLLSHELVILVFKGLVRLFALVYLLLVVRFAGVEQRILEQLQDLVHLLVHLH